MIATPHLEELGPDNLAHLDLIVASTMGVAMLRAIANTYENAVSRNGHDLKWSSRHGAVTKHPLLCFAYIPVEATDGKNKYLESMRPQSCAYGQSDE